MVTQQAVLCVELVTFGRSSKGEPETGSSGGSTGPAAVLFELVVRGLEATGTPVQGTLLEDTEERVFLRFDRAESVVSCAGALFAALADFGRERSEARQWRLRLGAAIGTPDHAPAGSADTGYRDGVVGEARQICSIALWGTLWVSEALWQSLAPAAQQEFYPAEVAGGDRREPLAVRQRRFAEPAWLRSLSLHHVGPAPVFAVELGERVNLFTGDNGLGKTFLLDAAWWVLTGNWAGYPVLPGGNGTQPPTIQAEIAAGDSTGAVRHTARFDRAHSHWGETPSALPEHALALYARVDGGFTVWDSARAKLRPEIPWPIPGQLRVGGPTRAFQFAPAEVWDGLADGGEVLCNGLIRDWVNWQYLPHPQLPAPFPVLERVLSVLSPHPEDPLIPGPPMRVSARDVRDVPTLQLPYGRVPVVHLSAGMKRILALAYLLVWTWFEHIQAARLLGLAPADRLYLLFDEVEAHLHPQWQRVLLPALLRVAEGLEPNLRLQILATTHAPLVLAAMEPVFDTDRDRMFTFAVEAGSVKLQEARWAPQGDAVGWLTSSTFGLKRARSQDAEIAIEAAEAFMRHCSHARLRRRMRFARPHRRLPPPPESKGVSPGTPASRRPPL